MINQRLYPDVKLGNATGGQTIASHGCFEISGYWGLVLRGYTFTVREYNQILVNLGIFPPNSALLAAKDFPIKWPKVYFEGRNEAWNDANLIKYMADKNYFVLGEVDARGIGGSGQHFVYIRSIEVVDGKIKMTNIDDPWGGLENQKVTTRYNQWGNILSLRVFKVQIKVAPQPEEPTMSKLTDFLGMTDESQIIKRLAEHLGPDKDSLTDQSKCEWGDSSKNGGFLGSARRDVGLLNLKAEELEKTIDQMKIDNVEELKIQVDAAYDRGFAVGKASVPPTPAPTEPTLDPQSLNPDASKYEIETISVNLKLK